MSSPSEGERCRNKNCEQRLSCARYLNVEAARYPEILDKPEAGKIFEARRDACFQLRSELSGEPANHRAWQAKSKRFRRRRQGPW